MMNSALRFRSVARTSAVTGQRAIGRPKSSLVKEDHIPHVEPNYTKTYGMVVFGGCAFAAVLDRMGMSHHDLANPGMANISRRDTLLDGVRGTNWH
jgi:hypothetical protein